MIFTALQKAIDTNCSDVHISTEGIVFRRKSELEQAESIHINNDDIFSFIDTVLHEKSAECKKRLDDLYAVDFSFSFSGRRFRANISRYSKGYNIACRILAENIETIESLNLPASIHKISELKNGLILVTGTTGSGKSTTLASIIEEINLTRSENILTIEDPIEYMYENKKSRIIQKEVGNDVDSFSDAVISAMRQDPDIILIGELRDLTTIRAAITLAETGHLVLSTIHSKSVFETVERAVGVFPPAEQEQIRIRFSDVVKAIIQQKLIKSSRGRVIPINEIAMVDETFANMLKKHTNINNIRDLLRSKRDKGNIHIVDNIQWHIANGHFAKEDIVGFVEDDDMQLLNTLLERR